jgi:hypothetical protein
MSVKRRTLLGLLGAFPSLGLMARTTTAAPRAPVRVLFTRVNGEHHYAAAPAIGDLNRGDPVRLVREPDNPHDRRAIEVFDARGRKLGYVARIDNSAVARMIDAGERFEARIAMRNRQTLDIRLEVDWLPDGR